MPFKAYLAELQSTLKSGQATEPSYYPALKALLEALDPKVQVLTEPRHIDVGHPDFRVQRTAEAIEFPVGHVEAKDIGEDLNKIEKSEQLKRYLGLPNLILTDFVEFRWYTNGQKRLTARLGAVHGRKLTPDPEGEAAVGELLRGFLRHAVPPVRTPKELALRMARLAHLIRGVILGAFEREPETGKLHKQFEAFQATLIPDLKPDQFADMYAQTIAYGLFAAACQPRAAVERFTREKSAHLIPKTNPFLRKLFNEIAGPELDDRIRPFVDDLVAVLRDSDLGSVLADFGKRTGREDPVVHFYEDFLKQYDFKVRQMRGVYYTPEPVVSYIVRSIDHLLKTRFNKPDGLADKDVLILDPACGTGTFLYYVIRHIHAILHDKRQLGGWNAYVSQNLLKRIFGFELLMAPYAVAHLKLGLLLQELDYKFDSDERLGVYLTNTLEEAFKAPSRFFPFLEALAEEGTAASGIKRDKKIMVVLGNPPYSNFGRMNRGKWIMGLLKDYKKDLHEKKINIDDDFIKFIRFGQWRIERTGEGILGFISNNTYIDGITHRRMRQSLMKSFSDIYVLDLHGSSKKKEKCPDGSKDDNVFDIQQGVTIGLFVKESGTKEPAGVHHTELWGLRERKYGALFGTDVATTGWTELAPKAEQFFFIPKDLGKEDEYTRAWAVKDIFVEQNTGIQTKRDNLTIHFSKDQLKQALQDLLHLSERDVRQKYHLPDDGRDWAVSWAMDDIASAEMDEDKISPILYRPLDIRWTYFTGKTKGFLAYPRRETSQHMLHPNLALVTLRINGAGKEFVVLVADTLVEKGSLPRGNYSFFPLYLYPKHEGENGDQKRLPQEAMGSRGRRPNLNPAFIAEMEKRLALSFAPGGTGGSRETFGPEDIFHYAYAIFHSATYRQRYVEFLKIDFPRVPLTSDKKLFAALVEKGQELVALHLMESPALNEFITGFPVSGDSRVEKVRYEEASGRAQGPALPKTGRKAGVGRELDSRRPKGRVYINKAQYFDGVPKDVWEFHIGGYQVCEKWLKDRQKAGRKLSADDIAHYQKIVVALNETIRLMREIDEVIPGWPLP